MKNLKSKGVLPGMIRFDPDSEQRQKMVPLGEDIDLTKIRIVKILRFVKIVK